MDALAYAREMVAFESTSRLSNAAISDQVEQWLKGLGFETERIEYDDVAGVRKVNIVGRKGRGSGGLAYFGHTDVVPADNWFSDEHGPFDPTVRDGRLYGRGSCDMKGSIACMLEAAGRFQADALHAPIYVTCTADEEIGYGGATEVAARSELYREMVAGDARGIIGEPTLLEVVYAHKGTYGFKATSKGKAAHSSTNEGLNANLAMIPFLQEMKAIHDETLSDPEWLNPEFDPPTISWNIGINDHTTAINITPPQSVCTVYFRPMPGQQPERLIERVRRAADANGLHLDVRLAGSPLYVDPKSEFVSEMLQLAGRESPQTVSYGTDGAMFGDLKYRVVFGPGSIRQAHTWDEWISLDQLTAGVDAFTRLVERWCV